MNIEITGTPAFHLPLTPLHIDVLMRLSDLHYDGTCKAASKLGGFLYGWNNAIQWRHKNPDPKDDTIHTVRADWHNLDICLKIMEIAYMRGWLDAMESNHSREDIQTAVHELELSFRGAMRQASHEREHWLTIYRQFIPTNPSRPIA